MNKDRRKQIRTICAQLKRTKEDLESLMSEEQNSYDSIPENLQESDRAQESEEALDNLDDAIDAIVDAVDSLQNIM